MLGLPECKEGGIYLEINITTPLKKEEVKQLKAGDFVFITGVIYTARDAAHEKFHEAIAKNEKLPLCIKESILYYMGPSPAREGQVIGSAGPTTSSRMDRYTPELLEMGLAGMIGKGIRSNEVITSMKKNKAVYFAAIGGVGALLSKSIKKSKVIAYEELGTEAIHELYVERLPVIVVIDSEGKNLYEIQNSVED